MAFVVMGAVRGSTPQAVHDALALHGTGVREEIPESDITGADFLSAGD